MSLIVLMRHGEALNNVKHILTGRTLVYHLTERGRLHVHEACEMLKPMRIEAVYTSPIARAVETASIVGENLALPYTVDERLTETDMGKLTGMNYFDVIREYRGLLLEFYSGRDVSMYGLENFNLIRARVLDMMDHVAGRHKGNVLLITHLDPIKAVVQHLLKVSADVLLNLQIKTASLTIVSHSSSNYELLAYNVTSAMRYL
ncbi:MAG: histidine phosphatase family protein [Candidatus Nitrosocaldus sp.]|nr:histidine phosphatase family protein [Candidatus Nitrosocaldus sp.]MDW8275609.1 histidine phosphatase family protein [Candidatus Nitrosocaldus sp.]